MTELALMDTDFFKPAVARGAGFLDDWHAAPLWRPQIDLTILDLGHSDRCVLGQLFGGYGVGLDALHVRARAADLGFAPPEVPGVRWQCSLHCSPEEQATWEALTEAWRRELAPA